MKLTVPLMFKNKIESKMVFLGFPCYPLISFLKQQMLIILQTLGNFSYIFYLVMGILYIFYLEMGILYIFYIEMGIVFLTNEMLVKRRTMDERNESSREMKNFQFFKNEKTNDLKSVFLLNERIFQKIFKNLSFLLNE